MLAIVFWNSRRTNASENDYRSSLIEFHQALNKNKPAGFRFSVTYRAGAVPWFAPKNEIFEDWYLLSNFAAMDVLDRAVLSTHGKEAHRYLMSNTGQASGAAFGLTRGMARMENLPVANWLQKPRNVSDCKLLKTIEEQLPAGKFSFWSRAMALGPTEQCVLSSGPVALPSRYRAVSVQRKLVWSPAMASHP